MTFTQNINEKVIYTTIHDRKYIGYILCLVTIIVIVVNIAAIIQSISWQVGFRICRKMNIRAQIEVGTKMNLNDMKRKRLNK